MPGMKVYLSDDEKELAERRAAEHGISLSYLVRYGVRLIIGMPIPSNFDPREAENGQGIHPHR